MIPPILEIYAFWHPRDSIAEGVARALFDHFHGTTYSGLVGGAVEVYVRSVGWLGPGQPPRPLPHMEAHPNGIPRSLITAVVPLLGTHLSRAVEEDAEWAKYVRALANESLGPEFVGVFPVRLEQGATETLLGKLIPQQCLAPESSVDTATLTRELAQSIAQLIGDPLGKRLQVFISHTKRHSADEESDAVDELVALVRKTIGDTHLAAFFDEADIQPGVDWQGKLTAEASRSGLLVIRTDLYAGREWCQREVLAAKRAGMPIVTLLAIRGNEERGSFLMDHVPSVPLLGKTEEEMVSSIVKALNLLVDEALKRALWNQQRRHLADKGFDWLPVHAPEPVTMGPWLKMHQESGIAEDRVLVMHPDPPLGPGESVVIEELCELAGMGGRVDLLTPRTFSSRGGHVPE